MKIRMRNWKIIRFRIKMWNRIRAIIKTMVRKIRVKKEILHSREQKQYYLFFAP